MEIVTDATLALREELSTARELLDAYRALARQARRELELEQRQTARLADRVDELEKQRSQLEHPGCTPCPACNGPSGRPDQTACIDCEPGVSGLAASPS